MQQPDPNNYYNNNNPPRTTTTTYSTREGENQANNHVQQCGRTRDRIHHGINLEDLLEHAALALVVMNLMFLWWWCFISRPDHTTFFTNTKFMQQDFNRALTRTIECQSVLAYCCHSLTLSLHSFERTLHHRLRCCIEAPTVVGARPTANLSST
jgi:hypothetical protein